MKGRLCLGLLALVVGCAPMPEEQPQTKRDAPPIDQRSYQLGVIGAFAEVVGLGIKKLALSSPMTPEEMDALIDEAERIVARNGARSYREEDFLVTDLFPAEITEGKQVLLIYLDPVKNEYVALKAEKEKLLRAGLYEGEARREIARKMGRLLSYPEEKIEQMLARSDRR